MYIPTINENQYHSLFLDEERHYPKFLDNLKFNVSCKIYERLNDMIGGEVYKNTFTLPVDCEYVDEILVGATITVGGDLTDPKSYTARYFNNDPNLVFGKVHKPVLIISCPSSDGKIDLMTLTYVLSHELTHLYDDWVSISNGNGCISANDTISDTTSLIGLESIPDNTILKDIAFLSYMSLKTEKQAFLSQTVQELKALDCTMWNYKEVIKKTTLYNNVYKAHKNFTEAIENLDSEQLYDICKYITDNHPNANVPQMSLNVFNPEKYKIKLMKWADKNYKDIMKRYGSVVSYYLDGLREQFNRGRSLFVY